MNASEYAQWLRLAQRLSRRPDEADDLLQDALLVALRNDRFDLGDEENRKWLTGVLKNRAAMTARSEARRRKREDAYDEPEPTRTSEAGSGFGETLDRFPPAARRVVVLLMHGLSREEIVYVLRISPTAFRQRLTSIRRILGTLPESIREEALALAYHRSTARRDDLEVGLIRRALLAHLKRRPGIGTHDPDGHLIVIAGR